MKMFKILFFSGVIFFVFLQSCGDCPVKDQPPSFYCSVREGTISEFNPRLVKRIISPDSIYYEPVQRYSIHTFLFPSNNNSSGELTNDERYEETEKIPILDPIPFSNGQDYYAALVDYYPLNSTMIGDVMVLNVSLDALNPLNSTAELKIYGYISRFPHDFFSENSDEFCAYISSYSEDELDELRIQANKYGADLPNARAIEYNADSNYVALDASGNVVDFVSVPQDDKATLQEQTIGNSVLIKVKIGQVYFYKARNGGQFVFVVSDIRAGTQLPHKRRVTLMFNPLK